jgi:hypothetical protein
MNFSPQGCFVTGTDTKVHRPTTCLRSASSSARAAVAAVIMMIAVSNARM